VDEKIGSLKLWWIERLFWWMAFSSSSSLFTKGKEREKRPKTEKPVADEKAGLVDEKAGLVDVSPHLVRR